MKTKHSIKKSFLSLLIVSCFVQLKATAQNDTIYFIKNGAVITTQSIKKTDVDSVVFYNPEKHSANNPSSSIDSIYFVKNGLTLNKISIMKQDLDSISLKRPALPTSGTFVDVRDGNVYKWVKIGNQVWLAENLRYLPNVTGPKSGSRSIPYIYVYGYNGTSVDEAKATTNYSTYGVMYNWIATMAGETSSSTNPSKVRGICPVGWHLPSEAELNQLISYLGGSSAAGGKLKETETNHWKSPNQNATNSSGFSALGGGDRYGDGTFFYLKEKIKFWSCTSIVSAGVLQLTYDSGMTEIKHDGIDTGNYIRCIKD